MTSRIIKAAEITVWVVCSLYAVALTCAEPMGAKPTARAFVASDQAASRLAPSGFNQLSQGEEK